MKKIFPLFILIIGIAACTKQPQPTPSIQTTSSPEPTATSITASPSITASAKVSENSFVLSQTLSTDLFSIKYPKDMTVDQSNGTPPRIYKTGPTQKGQTEMYDGLILTFETASNDNKKTLSEFVKNRTETDPNHSEIIEQPTLVKLNNYTASKYRSRGQGEYDTYVIESIDKSSFIIITILAEDPTKMGFQRLSVEILNSIMLKK